MGSGCIDPYFFDLGTRWSWVFSFTPQPLWPQGKGPLYPLDRRLGGPQSGSGRREKEIILDSTGTETPIPDRPVRSQSLYPIRYPSSSGICVLLTYWDILQESLLETVSDLLYSKIAHVCSRVRRIARFKLVLYLSGDSFQFDAYCFNI
jgi:hypothetical protein